MSQVAILARVTVKEGKAGPYLAALEPLLEQARREPGTLLYAVHRSADDPQVFWTTEIYADDAAFFRHGVFIVENLDLSALASDGVHEFALILTHPKLRGATGAWTSPIALV